MYYSTQGVNMYKSIKVKQELWKRLKQMALDKECSITKVLEDLLNGK